ncbi:MAG: HAMP domain-containing sensor histidine kinase [Lachnospiraceae bacterium]
MMNKSKKNPHASIAITLIFSLLVFIIFVITMLIVGGVIYLLTKAELLGETRTFNVLTPIFIFSMVSITTGTVVATIISSIPMKPVNKLINGLNQLANGKYDTRLNIGKYKVGSDISESFNILANELQNTEMLRTDFINNFSHEFKTPIVSIRGFAKLLLKENNLSEKQKEYLTIIAEESGRLADMATKILNLTKLENQNILTDITYFNLSEQMRNSILILEKKWNEKNLKVIADFEEYTIQGNEDLLKQIWINLIDNSIKFSYEHNAIKIGIEQTEDKTIISISNNGPKISEDAKKRIFNKYYQEEVSHFLEGTGLGLSIAKKIIELHKGKIVVESTEKETIFYVELQNTFV